MVANMKLQQQMCSQINVILLFRPAGSSAALILLSGGTILEQTSQLVSQEISSRAVSSAYTNTVVQKSFRFS